MEKNLEVVGGVRCFEKRGIFRDLARGWEGAVLGRGGRGFEGVYF